MRKKVLLTVAFTVFVFSVYGQDADEIITNYIENTGGYDAWKDLKSMKMKVTIDQGQMQLNATMYRKNPDLQRTEVSVQGKTIVQAYDGTTGWFINPMMGSEDPQKMPQEMVDAIKEEKFESEFIDYKEKGHTIELEGIEEVEGAETYKIKLSKKEGDVEYHFFDMEYFVPVMIRTSVKMGPQKGQEAETFMSDYQEVDGLIMPFFIEVKSNGQSVQKITIEEYALNEEMDDVLFVYPSNE